MRSIQALVIVMGILIVGGMTLVGYQIVTTVGESPAAPASFGEVELALPPGARVLDMAAIDDRLVLRVEGGDGRQRLLVLDPSTGALVGTMVLTPAP
jgi:hypothetical protein